MIKFNVIYADPPWGYYNDTSAKQDCTTVKGMRRPPYSTMSSADIMSMNVKDISADDAILFIWTTDYHLEKCLGVIKAWGFEYKTVAFSWLKLNKSNKPVTFMGAYTMKSGIENCLLATRGKNAAKLVKSHKVRALIEHQRMKHSKKPDEIRDRIVQLVGDIPRVELFARCKTDGWSVWGNEVESDIEIVC